MTLNRDEYGSQRSGQPENVYYESIVRGLKSDVLTNTLADE